MESIRLEKHEMEGVEAAKEYEQKMFLRMENVVTQRSIWWLLFSEHIYKEFPRVRGMQDICVFENNVVAVSQKEHSLIKGLILPENHPSMSFIVDVPLILLGMRRIELIKALPIANPFRGEKTVGEISDKAIQSLWNLSEMFSVEEVMGHPEFYDDAECIKWIQKKILKEQGRANTMAIWLMRINYARRQQRLLRALFWQSVYEKYPEVSSEDQLDLRAGFRIVKVLPVTLM